MWKINQRPFTVFPAKAGIQWRTPVTRWGEGMPSPFAGTTKLTCLIAGSIASRHLKIELRRKRHGRGAAARIGQRLKHGKATCGCVGVPRRRHPILPLCSTTLRHDGEIPGRQRRRARSGRQHQRDCGWFDHRHDFAHRRRQRAVVTNEQYRQLVRDHLYRCIK